MPGYPNLIISGLGKPFIGPGRPSYQGTITIYLRKTGPVVFRIGEFARMGRVSVRTLHHYEELGLLKPQTVDSFSGYRYYSTSQLPRLSQILALKELGFSLEQISPLLDQGLSPTQLEALLLRQRTELVGQLDTIRARLTRLDAWLSQIHGENKMEAITAYEISLKEVEPHLVASLRRAVGAYSNLSGPFSELRAYLAQSGVTRVGPSMIIWHSSSTEEDDQQYEVELIEPLDAPLPSTSDIKIYTLPAIQAASVTHQGSLETAYEAYQALGSWVEAQGYRPNGPTRQIHHVFSPSADPTTYVTEFQFPVEKII